MKGPKAPELPPKFYAAEQLGRLIRAIDADAALQGSYVLPGQVHWLRRFTLVAAGSGLRRGELCNLKWKQVDLEGGLLYVQSDSQFATKTGDGRAIALLDFAVRALRELEAERQSESGEEHVFRGWKGGKLNAEYVGRRPRHYRRLAKLLEGLHVHALRHSFASYQAQAGESLYVIQKQTGHKTPRMTTRYAHLMPEHQLASAKRTSEMLAQSASL